jgi:hypothetical protein
METLQDTVDELEKKVSSLLNIAKVIGIVAIIFGVAGSWGYSILSDAKKQIDIIRKDLTATEDHFEDFRTAQEQELAHSEEHFRELRKQQEAEFAIFVSDKRQELLNLPASWPGGSYCIVKRNSCPTGFTEGKLHVDTEDDKGDNKWSGTLPSFGFNGNNIDMYFCCK